MKKSIWFLFIALHFWGAIAIKAQESCPQLTNAFKRGNAQELSTCFGSKVELVLSNSPKEYTKQEATEVVRNFFNSLKVNSFTVNHEGKRNESSFIIGTLVTSVGVYRINCYFKKKDNQFLIHQIRIDKSNE